ncbi:MAG: hypothetical protein C5B50_28705 [Verrucomicrobia bacterium]|nr:MAG: hypothetical protein C5B50_28705 [Verrucomicrobiota bacterium]
MPGLRCSLMRRTLFCKPTTSGAGSSMPAIAERLLMSSESEIRLKPASRKLRPPLRLARRIIAKAAPPLRRPLSPDPPTPDPLLPSDAFSRMRATIAALNQREIQQPKSVLSTSQTRTPLARFSCWCPKVMAAIGNLPETLSDRCIIIRMQRKSQSETCERLRSLDGAGLRRRCLRFVKDNADVIRTSTPQIPPALNDRAADIWEPLLVIADLAGAQWPSLARDAALNLSSSSTESSPFNSLLLDLLLLFSATKEDGVFSRDLVACLNEDTDRPWAESLTGSRVTERWLSRQLRPYGVRTRNLLRNGIQAKGYLRDDIVDLFKRYVPQDALLKHFRQNETIQTRPVDGSIRPLDGMTGRIKTQSYLVFTGLWTDGRIKPLPCHYPSQSRQQLLILIFLLLLILPNTFTEPSMPTCNRITGFP